MKVVPVIGLILLTARTPLAEPPSEYVTTFEDKFVPPPPPSSTLGSQPTSYSGSLTEGSVPSTNYGLPSLFPPSALVQSINQLRSQNKHTAAIFGSSPSRHESPSSSFGTPSSSYGTPTFSYGGSTSLYSGQQESVYSTGGYDEDDQSEPANYEFSYSVYDPPSGNDFGHHETRHGDATWGSYMVLLPDGRRQIVEYQADQYGYRPVIRYEDAQDGYGNGNDGYSSGGNY